MKKALLLLAAFLSLNSFAHAQTFWDVEKDSPQFVIVESLHNLGVIHGYGDGSFRADQSVTRAESVKMILAAAKIQLSDPDSNWNHFYDLEENAWYLPFVYTAYNKNIVDGNNTDGSFAPHRLVNKAEALKMLIMSFSIDLNNYQNITSAVSQDVTADAWFSPYFNYAKKVSIISPTPDNFLEPDNILDRGELAEIIYNMIVLKYGGSLQELLNLAEAELINIIVTINQGDIDSAIKSADNAVFYTNTALNDYGDIALVQAANKISLGFKELCLAYIAGLNNDYPTLQQHITNAKEHAGAAYNYDSSTQPLGQSIKQQGDFILTNFQ